MLIRYGSLVASYFSKLGNTSLIIRCRGMPGLPSDSEDAWKFLQTSGYDVVVPDYYGFARSEGLFTPLGCIQTVVDTAKTFREGKVLDVRANTEIFVHYDEIILVGSSFGGWIACMAPKFDPTIKEIVLQSPQLASAKYGTLGLPEEDNISFWRVIKAGYAGLIRLGDEKERQTLCADEGPYIPTIHYEQLRDVRIFMGHGTADEVIHYSRTRDFCEQLQTRNPHGSYQFVGYYGLGHGGTCKNAIMEGWLRSKMQDPK